MSSIRSSNNGVTRGFSCEFCDERLQTSDDMRKHLWKCASKTDQCPYCRKYILRAIYAYHISHDCSNPDLFEKERQATSHISHLNNHATSIGESTNISSDQIQTESSEKFESLFKTATNLQETLSERFYQSEVEHVTENLQFNIVIIGSPRVGKSELINALCNGKHQAGTSRSLDSCTKEVKCYSLNDSQHRTLGIKPCKINFYDTPGIESWENESGKASMIQFIEQTNPVCVIYCASPGSFAKLEQLHSVLEYCKTKEIFCALICTNMWSGSTRHMVIKEFEKELAFFGNKQEKLYTQLHSQTPHTVIFFGTGALCTMVNSIEYYDPDFSDQRKPVQGIDELIHGIMESLDQEKLLGWCYAVLYRRTFWEKMSQQISGFFTLRLKNLQELITLSPEKTASNFLDYSYNWIFKKKT